MKVQQDKSFGGYLFASSLLLIPAALCTVVALSDLIYQKESYGFLVAVFSIFAAFLFASQISAFTIFQGILSGRAINLKNDLAEAEGDKVSKSVIIESHDVDKESIRRGFALINCAISYSVTLSIIILMILIVLFLASAISSLLTLILTFLMAHFFLVLIFTIGQSHEVFSLGYGDG